MIYLLLWHTISISLVLRLRVAQIKKTAKWPVKYDKFHARMLDPRPWELLCLVVICV